MFKLPGFTAEYSLVRRSAHTGVMHTSDSLRPTAREAVIPQWTSLRCPNGSLQTACSAAFYPASFTCAPLGWFNHGAEIACATAIMDAHFPFCAPCSVT
jgi:hypothetical protein